MDSFILKSGEEFSLRDNQIVMTFNNSVVAKAKFEEYLRIFTALNQIK